MNNNNQNEYNRLTFENFLSLVFIILNVFNIKSNKIIQSSLINETELPDSVLKFFRISITITFLAYIYYVIRNYSFYKNAIETTDSTTRSIHLKYVRLIGSIFILIGGACLLYSVYGETSAQGDVEL